MNTTILQGKTVVVTGGSSGIGRAVCLRAAEHGAKAVIVSDITETVREGGEPTVSLIEKMGVKTRFVHADVSKKADNEKLIEAAREFGGVDVMVCNAGITLRNDGIEVSEEDFIRLMQVNLNGTLFGAQAAGKQMQEYKKGGSIVLMSSMGGVAGAYISLAYSTSKGGIIQMMKSLADGFGPDDIRVNAVAPGNIDTELLRSSPGIKEATEGFRQRTPLRRLGKPSEIADTVAFLGSDLSSYITGVTLLVDGGLLAVI